jgi:MFS family permease
LLTATFFVQASNAAITTMIAIVIAEAGGSQGDVALIAILYSVGFMVGCFVSPAQIQRLGYIRAFTSATAILTVTVIALDMVDGIGAWAFLRFSMGTAMAAVLAIADGWINSRTPNERRGRVIAIYSIVLSLASVLSQFMFLFQDAGSEDFVLYLAIAMNIAVVLVAITSAAAPDSQMKTRKSWRVWSNTSVTASVGAFSSGFMTTAYVSILPFYLTKSGVVEDFVAIAMIVTFSGRLLFQWPVGQISDRIGRRSVLIGLSACIAVLSVLAIMFARGEGRIIGGDEGALLQGVGLLVLLCLGGLMWPIYSVSSSLAFDRAEAGSLVDVSTTLLVINTIGSIAGPLTVMSVMGLMGYRALAATILMASVLTASVAFIRARMVEVITEPKASSIPVPVSSIEMVQVAAEVAEEEIQGTTMEEGLRD